MPNFVPDPRFTGVSDDVAAVAAPFLQKHRLDKRDKGQDKADGTETGGNVEV